jgi:hypothetical protein
MKIESLFSVCFLLAGMFLLQGCNRSNDELSYEAIMNPVSTGFSKQVQKQMTRIPALKMTATPFSSISLFGMPNNSFGEFTAQVTVSYRNTAHLVSGTSCGSLQIGFLDSNSPDGGTFYHLSAAYDSENQGFDVFVADAFSGQSLGDRVPFDSTRDIDLSIQQTDTQLVFTARQHGDDTWTPIYTLNATPSANPVRFAIGTRQLPNKGAFYFSNLRINSEKLGGESEGPIVAHVQAAVDATDSARVKISAQTPDLNGAASDLDLALSETNAAKSALSDAVTGGTLQSNTDADDAARSLASVATKLDKAHNAVATLQLAKAKAQLSPLKTIRNSEMLTLVNLVGADFGDVPRAKLPMLKAAFLNIYSWHTE